MKKDKDDYKSDTFLILSTVHVREPASILQRDGSENMA